MEGDYKEIKKIYKRIRMSSPRNEDRFKRTYISLRVGINRYYYQDHPLLKNIIKNYDEHFYQHIHIIYDMNIKTLCRFIHQYERKIMYHNILNLYLLFFIIDYGKVDQKVNDFLYLIMEEGFQNEYGRGKFQPYWEGYFAKLGLSKELFPTLSLLCDYEYSHSIFYMKENEVVNKRVSEAPVSEQKEFSMMSLTLHGSQRLHASGELTQTKTRGEVVLSPPPSPTKFVEEKVEMVPVMKEISMMDMNKEKIYLTQIQNLMLEIQIRNRMIERFEKEVELKNHIIHQLGLENHELKKSLLPSSINRSIWQTESKMEFDKAIIDSFEHFFN